MATERAPKILRTKTEIMGYLRISSEDIFYRLIQEGMPCAVIDGRWYAHTENLDDYFKHILLLANIKHIPKDAE